jgi:hypothetical protein
MTGRTLLNFKVDTRLGLGVIGETWIDASE